MQSLWEIAIAASGLGAVACMVFFYLFRQILNLGIFSALDSNATERILRLIVGLIFVFCVLVLAVSLFQLLGRGESEPRLLSQFRREYPEVFRDYGRPPSENIQRVAIWQQFFEKGFVIYEPGYHVVIFDAVNGLAYRRSTPTPPGLVTTGVGNTKINTAVFSSLLEGIEHESRDLYTAHLVEGGGFLRGGIATVYLQDQLFPVLGHPLMDEFESQDVIRARTGNTWLYVGAANHPSDLVTKIEIRGAWVADFAVDGAPDWISTQRTVGGMYSHGTFRKYRLSSNS